jgi:RimJ/RimL family protein N-acetyltransferase
VPRGGRVKLVFVTELRDGAIVLRPFTEEDVPAITAACQDPEIPRWTRVPSPYTEDDARSFVARAGKGTFAIVVAESDELLGAVGVHLHDQPHPSVGYWVKREARGQGTATRALRLLTRWAFAELRPARLSLVTDPDNVPSQRVAEKAGFRREGTLRSWLEIKGDWRDCVMFSLVADDL